ncbi:MAG: hypothetical protein ACLSE6_07840 [Alphaproteobacteria bacterium]
MQPDRLLLRKLRTGCQRRCEAAADGLGLTAAGAVSTAADGVALMLLCCDPTGCCGGTADGR